MNRGTELTVWEGRTVDEWREAWGAPALLVLDVAGSTNDVARALAEEGAPAGTAVIAERQTAGRGRGGRRWHAPPGTSLLVSVLMRPRADDGMAAVATGAAVPVSAPDAPGVPAPATPAGPAPGAVPLRMGLAVLQAAERVADVRLGLKWPNDVVAPGAGKVAGILCEGSIIDAGGFIVVGIGVNVGQRAEDFPPDVRPTAVSLEQLAGRRISRAALCGAIMEEIRTASARQLAPLGADELSRIARFDVLRGRAVTVDGRPAGTALGVAPDGALLIATPEGTTAPLHSGTLRVLGDETSGPRERYP